MGMSASQARLLSLTARQSNLEFEGQQINQQRTCLSNQSANYYNSLLTMNVPTPPSTDDYTTVKYEFTISGNNATISQVLPQDKDGNYIVSYNTTLSTIGIQENSAYKISATANASSIKTGKLEEAQSTDAYDSDNEYYVLSYREDSDSDKTIITNKSNKYSTDKIDGATFFDEFGNEVEDSIALKDGNLKDGYSALVTKENDDEGFSLVYVKLADNASYKQAIESIDNKGRNEKVYKFNENKAGNNDGKDTIQTLSASNSTEFSSVSSEYAEAFLNANLDINDFYQYQSSTGIRFAKKKDVSKSTNTDGLTISTFAVASLSEKQNHTMSGVQVEFDASGRIATITDADGVTYTMTTSTVTDDAAYEDAYNQYTYDQYVYDQKQNEINANIEILQAQDKNLELRLSQLNTQHSAIQTEMDAVNKVLSKNIETSFKTFNA